MARIHGHKPNDSVFRGQRGAILKKLLENKGCEVPAYALADIGLQYCARLKEIRDLGYTVTNRTERVGGQVHGYYTLVSEPGEQLAAEPIAMSPSRMDGTLFGSQSEGVRFAYPD